MGWGCREPRLVYTPDPPASLAMELRGEFLCATACGGQKATSAVAVLGVTPSGDTQGKPLCSKGWSRAGSVQMSQVTSASLQVFQWL